jgi:ribonuclease D
MTLITTTEDVARFCRGLETASEIAVDTEFMRERTYWPKLCLVQVAGPDASAAIDPLADGIDLAPLYRLLEAPNIVKVFHAGRQDLEIFYHLIGRLPAPIFDTQLAAMVCGFGDQVSYETLVAKLARAKLDKGSRFTDWSIRPLSRRQIDYALADVIHLRTVYQKLKRRLDDSGRANWLEEEIAIITNTGSYDITPELAYRRIKSRRGSGRFLAILREVAAWREREAQSRDVPRNWILRDEALVEIAHHEPQTEEALARTRGLGRKVADGDAGHAILAAVRRGMAVPDADCPQQSEKHAVPRSVGPVCELLKVLLKLKCDEADVAQRLVASADEIERLAADGENADIPALRGWRRQVYGEDALALRRGEVALAVDGRRLSIVSRAD